MRAYVLGSGSSGNALLVETEGVRILVDAGIGPRVSATRLHALGSDLFPRGVDAIVVTHHHGDHAAQLEPLCRALGVPKAGHVRDGDESGPLVFLHDGIEASRVRHRFAVRRFVPGHSFRVRGVEVRTMTVPHDAPQVAVVVATRRHALGMVTDIGAAPRGLVDFFAACDTVLLESNYCSELLEDGPYPLSLKRRVAGGLGHLANDEAGRLAAKLAGCNVSRVFLCHLSRSNNTPERALRAVRDAAPDLAVEAIPHGEPRLLDLSPGSAPGNAYRQLTLPL